MAVLTQRERSEASVEKTLDAALKLFSSQGFRATSIRQIADEAGLSVGNVYHHFPNKESIFQRLFDDYWAQVLDPDLPLMQIFARAEFPDDLEAMATAIEEVVERFRPYILLIYVDVIEFEGEHIRAFYGGMPERFQQTYAETFAAKKRKGELGDVDPMVAVMVATRWLFYFYTVERCFGVPMHFGMSPDAAVHEFIRIMRYGILPREAGRP